MTRERAPARPRLAIAASISLALALGCGAAATPVVSTAVPVTESGGGGNANGTSEPEPFVAPSGPASIALAPGFTPRPMVFSGTAGGPADASSVSGGYCIGYLPRSPQHVLEISTPIPYLAIGAYGARDLTLAVRLPDRTWRCNDDWDGLNPRVEGPLPRGRVDVYVGTYSMTSQGDDSRYALGLSEDSTFMPSMLPYP